MKQSLSKKKKLLLMLPLFVAPVVALVLLFTGSPNREEAAVGEGNAFNASLPSANVKEAGTNKLEIYMQAQKDSAKQRDQLLQDPNSKFVYDPAPPVSEQEEQLERSRITAVSQALDPNERKVTERLDRLMKELNQPVTKSKAPADGQTSPQALEAGDIHQLENLLASMQAGTNAQDPEMAKIETVLEKVLDIQHPERVKDRLAKKKEPKAATLPVTTHSKGEDPIGNGFYGIQDELTVQAAKDASTISAVVPDDQVIADGGTMKLRLLQHVFVGQTLIPKGTLASGRTQFNGDRVQLQIKELVYNKTIYPVSLTVYDMDGLPGINVPGVMGSEVAKNGVGQAIQDIDMLMTNPSLATQVATTGMQAAKNLLTKKVKAVKATIKGGHQVLLKTDTSF